MPQILDIEQAVLLLELEPPFDKREVQLARRRMAKRWHPDIAPPGRQHEHERHLKAINEAADQLEQIAEESRGGKVSRNAVKVSAAAARKRRAEEGARAYAEEQRRRAARGRPGAATTRSARACPTTRSCTATRAACPIPSGASARSTASTSPATATTSSSGRASRFQVGVRTVPAGSLQFVDFSKPDPGAERVERFMTAAKHALAEGDFALAARRLVYARDAEPRNTAVLRLMTLAFWQAGNYSAAARAVRDWAREEGDRPAPHRYAARIYEDMGSLSLAVDAAEREVDRAPDGRLGLGAARPPAAAPLRPRGRARGAGARARDRSRASRGCSTWRWSRTWPATSAPRCRPASRRRSSHPDSAAAWSRYAHALARTDRTAECLAACERALALLDDPEVRDLREQVLAMAPRELSSESAAA